jgi:glutamyl-tRNA reductase
MTPLTVLLNQAETMKLFVAGLSYKTAGVEVREKVAVSPARVRCAGCKLKVAGGLAEVVLLSTCNRVEIYGVSDRPQASARDLFRMLARDGVDVSSHVYLKQGVDALQHLFSVASGLDSMVLGETEITGQIKQAYQAAQASKLTGRVTNRAFQTAFQVGKEVRTTTSIGRGATSVGSVAVELAERIFDRDFSSKTVMIIGAGKMGEACVRHLAKKGAPSVRVVNRSRDKAAALAAEIGGTPVAFEDLFPAMREVDIVVSSTGARRTILHRAEIEGVMHARSGQPLFLIDIAVPRDIDADVQHVEGVYLYNIDHLQAIVAENVKHREQELARCQEIVAGSAAEVLERLRPAASAPAGRPAVAPAWGFATATATP